MKVILALVLGVVALPVFAAGPAQGPVQGPMQQAPNKAAMQAPSPSVAMQSGARRAYSYEPGAAPMARQSYSYQPSAYSAYPRRVYNPGVFTRTETVKSAAFKSVQQYGD